MTRWEVHAQADELVSGLELDFIETPQIDDASENELAAGDEITILWPGGGGKRGTVFQVEEGNAVIEIEEEKHPIRKPEQGEFTNPMQIQMRVIVWFVV